MRGPLSKNIFDLFTKEGRRAKLADLQKGGVKSVTVLGADQLAVLIERAMEHALEQRMLELSEPDKARILEDAHHEFERLRGELAGLETETERKRQELETVESRLVNLQSEFESANASLDAEILAATQENGVRKVDVDEELRKIHEVVRTAGLGESDLTHRVARSVSQYLERERAEAAERSAREQRDRIDTLERRLAKLNDQLTKTEAELESALESAQREEGIASIYKAVQGLRATARDFERKKAMLSEIFSKNLVLQKGAATP
jgi:archaellum component FlaC